MGIGHRALNKSQHHNQTIILLIKALNGMESLIHRTHATSGRLNGNAIFSGIIFVRNFWKFNDIIVGFP